MRQLRRWKRPWRRLLTRSHKKTSMGPSRNCWDGTTRLPQHYINWLRMGFEFNVCTINKSAHTKKVWKLIVCPSYFTTLPLGKLCPNVKPKMLNIFSRTISKFNWRWLWPSVLCFTHSSDRWMRKAWNSDWLFCYITNTVELMTYP